MIKKFFIIIIILSAFSVKGAIYCDSIIVWDKDFVLTWKYFKGHYPIENENESALLHVLIDIKGKWNKNLPDFDIYACFYPFKSWAKDTSSQFLLTHEQLHFHITEVYAREIRKVVKGLRNRNINNVDEYVKEIKNKMNEFALCQQNYDKETKHGTIVDKQIEWNMKIEKHLKELSAYELNENL
jgi:hypothetical protein